MSFVSNVRFAPVTSNPAFASTLPVAVRVPATAVLPVAPSTVNLLVLTMMSFVSNVRFAPATSRPLFAFTLPANVTRPEPVWVNASAIVTAAVVAPGAEITPRLLTCRYVSSGPVVPMPTPSFVERATE